MAGLLTIGLTYLVPRLGGAVDAYLTVISIMDMPLFVIAIPFGLLWKRTTWQGAMAGYIAGSAAGAVLKFGFGYEVAPVTILSGGVAAIVCPLVTLLTSQAGATARALEAEKEIRPQRPPAYVAGGWMLAAGFVIFLADVLMASRAVAAASMIAVGGMVVYFLGGLLMAKYT
jgi:Na+/proline symporter